MEEKLNEVVGCLLESRIKPALENLRLIVSEIKNNKSSNDIISDIEKLLVVKFNDFIENTNQENYNTRTQEEIDIRRNRLLVSLMDIVNRLRKYASIEISINNRETKTGVFYKADANELMHEICEYIVRAKSIRVIGESRGGKYEKEPIQCIEDYYKAIENRCSHDYKGKHQLVYRRITNKQLSKQTLKHLKKCYQGAEKNKNTFKVIFHGNLHLAFTYMIIDTIDKESILILSLYTKDNDIEIFDTSVAYYTFDTDTISKFKLHFQNAWEVEANSSILLKDLKEFLFYTPFNKEVSKRIEDIKKYSNEIPKDSIRLDHLKYHLKEFGKRLGQLSLSKIEVPHTDKNQRITTAYRWYLKSLTKGCNYKTISVLEFWQNIQEVDQFLRMHRDTFENEKGSGTITRIYVVDSRKLKDKKYIESQSEVLTKNFELAKEFPENYDFLVLFVDNYESFLSTNRNFAIWSKDNKYRVVFLSKYARDFTERGVTNIFFVEEWNNLNSLNLDNKDRYTKASRSIARSTNKVIAQNANLRKALAHRNSTSQLTSMNKEDIQKSKEQLNFLEACGVDVERFLY